MTENENKLKFKQTLAIFCVIFAVMMIIALITNLIRLASLNAREKELNKLIAELNYDITRLEELIALRETDEYIDRYVREWLEMHGKDEITFIAKK